MYDRPHFHKLAQQATKKILHNSSIRIYGTCIQMKKIVKVSIYELK